MWMMFRAEVDRHSNIERFSPRIPPSEPRRFIRKLGLNMNAEVNLPNSVEVLDSNHETTPRNAVSIASSHPPVLSKATTKNKFRKDVIQLLSFGMSTSV